MKISDVSIGSAVKVDYSSQSRASQETKPVENIHSSSDSAAKTGGKNSVNESEYFANEGDIMDDELLEKSVNQANRTLKASNRFIERKVHDVTHTVMYTLKDTSTGEVISEFPPKKIQDMIAKMWELAGLFVDEEA